MSILATDRQKLTISALIVILILLLGGMAYYIWQHQDQPTSAPGPTFSSQVQDVLISNNVVAQGIVQSVDPHNQTLTLTTTTEDGTSTTTTVKDISAKTTIFGGLVGTTSNYTQLQASQIKVGDRVSIYAPNTAKDATVADAAGIKVYLLPDSATLDTNPQSSDSADLFSPYDRAGKTP